MIIDMVHLSLGITLLKTLKTILYLCKVLDKNLHILPFNSFNLYNSKLRNNELKCLDTVGF